MISRIIDHFVERSPWAQEMVAKNDSLSSALETLDQEKLELELENARLEHSIEIERTRRISAETVAGERMSEIGWLREDLSGAREDLKLRLKSLDEINVKLLEPKAPVQTPNIEEWKQKIEQEAQEGAAQRATANLVRQIRQRTREIDLAILQKQFPRKSDLGLSDIPVRSEG